MFTEKVELLRKIEKKSYKGIASRSERGFNRKKNLCALLLEGIYV